jgi:hypothetical protein
MTNNLLWQRDNITANSTEILSFCASEGGAWPAFQALVAFMVTNIFAHAATIYVTNGSDPTLTFWSVFCALLAPVYAGDRAFHAIGRWCRHVRKGKGFTIRFAFGSYTFENAATSGALAIPVPLVFAPLLQGRWDSVKDRQRIVMLDNSKFQVNRDDQIIRAHLDGMGFKIQGKFPRYMPYILPPETCFPGYLNYRLSPQSTTLPLVIAVLQVFLSARQLYIKYDSSIRSQGLSSPYLVVTTYLLMSIVNLVANTLLGSYPQITVLPMDKENVSEINEAFLVSSKGGKIPRIIAQASHEENHLTRLASSRVIFLGQGQILTVQVVLPSQPSRRLPTDERGPSSQSHTGGSLEILPASPTSLGPDDMKTQVRPKTEPVSPRPPEIEG